MKKQFLPIMVSILFLLPALTISFASNSDIDGGTVLFVQEKNATTLSLSFSIPDIYLDASNNLLLPLEVNITDEAQNIIVTLNSLDTYIELPSSTFNQGDNYSISFSIGGYSGLEKFSW